jgi:phage pi2 protein 07
MRPEEKILKSKEKLENLSEQTMATARRVGEMELILYNIARENEILKDALQLLHEKLDAVIDLQNKGLPLIDENINEAVVSLKEKAMKDKIDEMLQSGTIKSTETIGEDSLVVSRELNKEGRVENPRLQFLVGRLIQELKTKFVGKKVGDLIKGDDNKLDIEIMEIYELVSVPLSGNNSQNNTTLPESENNQDS